MAKNSLKDLLVGDFFTAPNPSGQEPLLYQKIEPTEYANSVLLNTGQLCNVYEGYSFQSVTVTFDIKPTK